MAWWRAWALLGMLTAPFGAAWAHGFTAAMLIPGDLPTAREQAMVTAFLLAAAERDVHPAQQSDGHLGGLDVDLRVVRGGCGEEIRVAEADVAMAPLACAPRPRAVPVWTGARRTPPSIAEAEELARRLGVALDSFRSRFAARTGTPPPPEAVWAYLAAQAVDRAVRRLGGIEPREALARVLRQAR